MPFLLERLARIPDILPGRPDTFDLETAVAAQIQRIVSARPPDPASPDLGLLGFGMPSAVELGAGNRRQLDAYAERLAALIRRHEPRLLRPCVTLEPAPEALAPYRLAVSGTLAPDGDLHTFRFDLSEH